MHKAIGNAQKRWPSMQTYLEYGREPLDNTRCEPAGDKGRKVGLFAGAEGAGERISLVETARLNGLGP